MDEEQDVEGGEEEDEAEGEEVENAVRQVFKVKTFLNSLT